MRLAFGVEYNGGDYRGWQAQPGGVLTVQAKLEQAISQVANHPINVVCAGRTDAGVHATQQVVHCDVAVMREDIAWIRGTNANLPPSINVRWVREVPDNFSARFSATARSYQYVIYNHPVRPSLFKQFVSWQCRPLDVDSMHQAAQALLGRHDFSSFRGAGCQSKSPVRELKAISVTRSQDFVIVAVKANAFLYNMVRNIVGSLLAVGAGEQDPEYMARVLAARDRTQAGVTAVPEGLYLVGIDYPLEYNLPLADKNELWFTKQINTEKIDELV